MATSKHILIKPIQWDSHIRVHTTYSLPLIWLHTIQDLLLYSSTHQSVLDMLCISYRPIGHPKRSDSGEKEMEWKNVYLKVGLWGTILSILN